MAVTRSTAAANNIKLITPKSTDQPQHSCYSCALGKAHQKNVPKQRIARSTKIGERFFMDISSPRQKSKGGAHHWLLLIDDASDMCFSFFLATKDLQTSVLIPFFKDLIHTYKITPMVIRCDNAGENIVFQNTCKSEGLGIRFEFTAPGTPQQNGRVERKFQTLYGRVRAMLIGSQIEQPLRNSLWSEAANTATDLDNNLVKTSTGISAFQQFFGKGKKTPVDFTKKFGERCVVADRTKLKAKLGERGREYRWVGYAKDHSVGTYRFYNIRTGKIVMSRDVAQTVTTAESIPNDANNNVKDNEEEPNNYHSESESENEELDDDDDETSSLGQLFEDNRDSEDEMTEEVNPRVIRAARQLQAFYNPLANEILGTAEPQTGRDQPYPTRANVAAGLVQEIENYMMELPKKLIKNVEDSMKYTEPKTFDNAWNHPDPYQRKMWRNAMNKEYGDMNTRQVWRKIKRIEIPANRRCVKSKWVFKIKRDGTFRARIVACGYSQIPGVDFSDNYAPVVNDITFRLMLIVLIIYALSSKIADVETAFLYGALEEVIFMECPPGMPGAEEDEVLLLQKCIYGLVQAARQYNKKMIEILKKIGFTGGDVDPCLFVRRSSKGICFIAIYVDDNLLVGHPAAIEETIELLKENGLVLKVEDDLHDYLSCEIQFSPDKKKAWLGQPHLINKLEKKFGNQVTGKRQYLTPGTPGLNQIKEEDQSKLLSKEQQLMYRSGVGMLLYLVKHSRPDIANCVRELSKVLDGSTEASYKEMLRVIKYVLDTKAMGLKIWPTLTNNEPWKISVFTDSDYAGDPVTRRSVSGYVIYVHNVPVCWRSKAQRSVTLSSTEAEWVALSEAVKEVIFLMQLCNSMKIKIQLPVEVRVDNVGAIFMSKNVTTTSRTKHVDIRSKYVREYVEDGIIKIVFVKSEDNESDIMTKNCQSDLHSKHSMKLITEK